MYVNTTGWMSKQLKALAHLLQEEHAKRLHTEAALRDAADIFRHDLQQRQGLRYDDAWCGCFWGGGGAMRIAMS